MSTIEAAISAFVTAIEEARGLDQDRKHEDVADLLRHARELLDIVDEGFRASQTARRPSWGNSRRQCVSGLQLSKECRSHRTDVTVPADYPGKRRTDACHAPAA